MNEGGIDVAESAADVVLMRPNLVGIFTVIAMSRKSIYRIIFNFGWSFMYNLFAILLADGALVNARIPPEFAGLGDFVSVLPAIATAVLLRWSKIRNGGSNQLGHRILLWSPMAVLRASSQRNARRREGRVA